MQLEVVLQLALLPVPTHGPDQNFRNYCEGEHCILNHFTNFNSIN